MINLEKAKTLLNSNNYTLVLCSDKEVITTEERGIKPLVNWYLSSKDLHLFSCADKIVGKAASYLYIKLGIKYLYARVISEEAYQLLKNNQVYVEYLTLTKQIINRNQTGLCPFEELVKDCQDIDLGVSLILNKINNL